MTEIFKPRENMTQTRDGDWSCRDQYFRLLCDGGPSFITKSGYWEFWIHSVGYHRLDGPATSEGDWYINNKNVTKEIHQFAEENNMDLDNLSDEDKVLIALKFS